MIFKGEYKGHITKGGYLMKISKKIMNPARVQQLKIIAESKAEVNAMYVANKSGCSLKQVRLSIQRFRELGLIRGTACDDFVITDKGKQYLEEVEIWISQSDSNY
jgi:predicted transcriptional regulator